MEVLSADERVGWAVFGTAVEKDYGCDTAAASVGDLVLCRWRGYGMVYAI